MSSHLKTTTVHKQWIKRHDGRAGGEFHAEHHVRNERVRVDQVAYSTLRALPLSQSASTNNAWRGRRRNDRMLLPPRFNTRFHLRDAHKSLSTLRSLLPSIAGRYGTWNWTSLYDGVRCTMLYDVQHCCTIDLTRSRRVVYRQLIHACQRVLPTRFPCFCKMHDRGQSTCGYKQGPQRKDACNRTVRHWRRQRDGKEDPVDDAFHHHFHHFRSHWASNGDLASLSWYHRFVLQPVDHGTSLWPEDSFRLLLNTTDSHDIRVGMTGLEFTHRKKYSNNRNHTRGPCVFGGGWTKDQSCHCLFSCSMLVRLAAYSRVSSVEFQKLFLKLSVA